MDASEMESILLDIFKSNEYRVFIREYFSFRIKKDQLIKVHINMGGKLKGIMIVYDGECPVCRTYCKYLQIKKAVGEVRLVDARKPSAIMKEITKLGLNIDEGMVVKLDNEIYYGDQAVNILGILGTKNDWFNKVNYWVFRSKLLSTILYPLCKGVRNIILKCYGIKKIENIKK